MKKFLTTDNTISILIMFFMTAILYVLSSPELSIMPILLKISYVAMFFSSTFIILRLFDHVIDYDFNIEDIKNNISFSIYMSVRLFAVMLSLSLILM